MSNTDSYRLTSGILFNFLIEAKKPIISSKDKLGGKEDKLSNFKILENILKIFSENFCELSIIISEFLVIMDF